MAGDDDEDSMLHAADEPTAMWGSDALAELGLDRAPSEPPKGPAMPAKPSERGDSPSVKVTLDRSVPAAAPKKQSPKRSQAVTWVLTIVGALVLAVVAFFVVRALR